MSSMNLSTEDRVKLEAYHAGHLVSDIANAINRGQASHIAEAHGGDFETCSRPLCSEVRAFRDRHSA